MFEDLRYRLTRYKPRDEKEHIDTNALNRDEYTRSRRYHSYFEGYVERKVWDPVKRKERIERVYTEPYYSRGQSGKQRGLTLLLYALLALGGLALFIWGGAQRVEPPFRYVYLPTLAVLVLEILLLWTLANFAASPARLTVWEYSSGSRRLVKLSAASGICMLLQGAVLAVCMAVFSFGGGLGPRVCAVLGCALGAAANLALFCLEANAKYEKLPNENAHLKNEEGSHIIR